MKKALDLAFSDRSIKNRIASNTDFSSLRSRNLPSRVLTLAKGLLIYFLTWIANI